MATNNVRATLILRNDLAATWQTRNPILAKGEIGAEIDTGLLKIGDGSTAFNSLNYINLGKSGDGALVTEVNNHLTVADYGRSYWMYDNESARDIQVFENDLTKWPQTLELEIKNGEARWVVPKINYNRTQGKLDGALITLTRDPIYSNEASTKSYVDSAVASAIASAPHLKRQVVNELPAQNFDTNTIYMVKDNSVTGVDKYREYIAINGELILFGDTSVDLSGYIQKPATNTFTEGHLATFAQDGSLVDSGYSASQINNLQIATSSTLGGVYSSNLDNTIAVNASGIMQLNRVSTSKLYVPQGDEFVLNGGGA
jgi:hypothetical protein